MWKIRKENKYIQLSKYSVIFNRKKAQMRISYSNIFIRGEEKIYGTFSGHSMFDSVEGRINEAFPISDPMTLYRLL